MLGKADHVMIRAAVARDIPAMGEIEVAAGRVFATIGMDAIAEDRPFPDDVLLGYVEDGRAWVAVDDADRPVAYLIADRVDGNAHVEQVSVHPAQARRGLGARLIERAAQWGRERGAPALTLTTFAEVAWNAAYYERLGFRRLDDAELGPGMRRVRAEEAEQGLERWPRVSMRKELSPA